MSSQIWHPSENLKKCRFFEVWAIGTPKYDTLVILGPMTTKNLSNTPPRTSLCSPKVPQGLDFGSQKSSKASILEQFTAQGTSQDLI